MKKCLYVSIAVNLKLCFILLSNQWLRIIILLFIITVITVAFSVCWGNGHFFHLVVVYIVLSYVPTKPKTFCFISLL